MNFRPYLLTETNWKAVKETNFQLAVLPWGATEAHNYHLPYGTDNIQCDYIAKVAAAKAWDQGAIVIVLPTVPFGVNCQQLDIPLTINMNPSTQMAVLGDVTESLAMNNIPRLVVLNGHGGNDFRQMIRELSYQHPEMIICQVDWYKAITNWSELFEDTGDHAGEMETSIMMKIAPELVRPLSEAGSGKSKKLKFEGRREGWMWAPRVWTQVTEDTGIGDPAQASIEKGEKCLDIITGKIASFLVELAHSDNSDLYI